LQPVCVAGQGTTGFTNWVLDVKITLEKLLDKKRMIGRTDDPLTYLEKSREFEFEETLANETTRLTANLQNLSIETNRVSGNFHDGFLKSFGVNEDEDEQENPMEMSSFDLREYDPHVPWFRRIFIELGELAGSCIGLRQK
jgi:hypothetical protein